MRCRRSLVALVAAAAVALALDVVIGADEVCSTKVCYRSGGSKKCDRTSSVCPPCLVKKTSFLISSKVHCYDLLDSGECPETTTLCPSSSHNSSSSKSSDKSESGSGSGSSTPKPTTVKPTTKPPKPTTTAPSSSSTSKSGSGSGISTPTPTPKKTPKPTPTPKPSPTQTQTPTPVETPSVTPVETQPQNSQPASNSKSNKDEKSNSNLPLIIGCAGGAVVVIAVVAFFIWKRRQDDDDDSDDEDYRYNTSKAQAASGAKAAMSYNHPQARAQTSPGGQMGAFAAAGGGYGGNAYGASSGAGAQGPTYGGYGKNAGAVAAGVDYGSPSTIDGSHRSVNTVDYDVGPGGAAYDTRESQSSSEGGRDVWGNSVGPTHHENKRTHSNVSVEF